ncbi:MAG: hypothetical protein GC154_07120 [bacterium]|nr:hypothetical protein [bacterium]
MRHLLRTALFVISILLFPLLQSHADGARRVISLDGRWNIAEGGMEVMPERFAYVVPVPGLVDMSSPDFFEVGIPSQRREAFWYRREFTVEGKIPESALLKINKAKYGTRVYLNGELIGDHAACFTPGWFDVKGALKGEGQTNVLTIRVGAHLGSIPKSQPNGWDFEKYKYIPGIYDSVSLILTGLPRISNIQTAPILEPRGLRFQAVLETDDGSGAPQLSYSVHEAKSGECAASGEIGDAKRQEDGSWLVDYTIAMPEGRLWSPEDPFLYTLNLTTGADDASVRFGLRTFQFDPETGRAMLNGKPYFMRGTNVCIYRFFEDAARGNLPWDEAWVKKLHETFIGMNWNCIRYCIGFPPEAWYDIADELGFLIQDEFPIWSLSEWPAELKSDAIAAEYKEWMRERWNHPCVVIWDAQNESVTTETGDALMKVRNLDLSNRPWDNGWGAPQQPGDSIEAHPYFFSKYWQKGEFHLSELNGNNGRPSVRDVQRNKQNPLIINEYAWLWLNRDGSPTCLTREAYNSLLGENSTIEQRRELYARYLAELTELWRGRRQCAAVMHFCGLGYSRPGGLERPAAGATRDHFLDIANLVLEPHFQQTVRDAFAPTGVMIDFWDEHISAGQRTIPVSVINDRNEEWRGLVRLRLQRGDAIISEQSLACSAEALGKSDLQFTMNIDAPPGEYQLIAELVRGDDEIVRGVRRFHIE